MKKNKMKNWNVTVDVINETLLDLEALLDHKQVNADIGIDMWIQKTIDVFRTKNVIYFIGNGASATMASHMAADISKNTHIHTQVFTDLCLLTATANDISFDEVFAEPLRRRANKGDMLVAISSSGNSKNIINAIRAAQLIGCYSVTLSAMDRTNHIRAKGSLNFWLPAKSYGLAETCHAALLHHWADSIFSVIKPLLPMEIKN